MPLRTRILLGTLPLLLLLAGVGSYAVWLFVRLGGAVNTTLRENYASVAAMRDLRESALLIDRALSFQRVGAESLAVTRATLDAQAVECRRQVDFEVHNITEAGEHELAAGLRERNEAFLSAADAALRDPGTAGGGERRPLDELLAATLAVQQLNEQAMTAKDKNARAAAAASTRIMLGAIGLALPIAGFFAFRLLRTIQAPLTALTHSARALGEGNLDQVLPVTGQDELGQLADAFNKMAGKLRLYRQTTSGELVRARQAAQDTFAALPDPVFVFGADASIQFQNPAAECLRQRLQQAGATLPVVPLAAASVLAGKGDYLPEGFDKALVLRLNGHAEGGERETVFLPRLVGLRDARTGDVTGAVAVLQDVTRLRLMDEVKNNLVATVSHELKTPLTGLRMAIHLLLEERVGALNAKQTELLLAAREDSERLLETLDHLLDLARLEAGAGSPITERRSVPAADLLRRAADMGRELILAAGRTLAVAPAPGGLPPVLASVEAVDHVFSNLVNNAVKHSPPGEEITLSLRAEPAAGAVRFAVTDRGAGVPERERERIFERFYRLPGETKTGAGLGLAICREIVRAHGGSIGVVPGPGGRGSEFFFTLPVVGLSPAQS